MSSTDKTHPWWVQLAHAPMGAARPVHDHRYGPCTLPDEVTRTSASLDPDRAGCHWGPAPAYRFRRVESRGHREWNSLRRADRRRDRHEARRRLAARDHS